jgi:hypothetical protein
MRSFRNSWWLVALCGIFDAMCSALDLLMANPDASLGLRKFALPNTAWDISILALVAGACAFAAGLWNSGRDKSWLLSLHGLALGAFGAIGISPLVRGPLSFRPISLLFVLMALSIAAFALATARTDRWFLNVSGVAWIAFAISFIAIGFGWIRPETPSAFWLWMSAFFASCAIFMFGLALRLYGDGISPSGAGGAVPPVPSPRHAL